MHFWEYFSNCHFSLKTLWRWDLCGCGVASDSCVSFLLPSSCSHHQYIHQPVEYSQIFSEPWVSSYDDHALSDVICDHPSSVSITVKPAVYMNIPLDAAIFYLFVCYLLRNKTCWFHKLLTKLPSCTHAQYQSGSVPNQQLHGIIISKKINPSRVPIIFQNTPINIVLQHKHLGMTFSRDFTWRSHIENLLTTAHKRLGIFVKK
jgi:hypothetical protein